MAAGLLIADTDLIIDFLRNRDPGAGWVQAWLEADHLRLTAVTAFELRLGSDFLSRRDGIEALLLHRTLPLDLLAALEAGEMFSSLRSRGLGIRVNDALLAGTCRRFDLPLATRNVRHFERVAGLRLVPLAE